MAAEVVAANAALSTLLQRRIGDSIDAFLHAAQLLQAVAANLSTIVINPLADKHPRMGVMLGEVAPAVAAAGAAIVESSSVACTQVGKRLVTRGSIGSHYQAINLLMRLLNEMFLAHSPAVEALRATTFSPAVILACIGRCVNLERDRKWHKGD